MSSRWILLYDLVAALVLVGCAPRSQSSQSIEAGLGNMSYLWPNAEASVCYKNIDPRIHNGQGDHIQLFQSEQEIVDFINHIVDSQFNKRSVFTFGKMRKCIPLDPADIKVNVVLTADRSWAFLGTGREQIPWWKIWNPLVHLELATMAEMQLTALYTDQPQERNYSLGVFHNTVLHEFAHAAALEHEHARSENSDGKLCSSWGYGQQSPAAISIGPYDRESITNYCRPNMWSEVRHSLSDGDLRTLFILYGDPNNKRPSHLAANAATGSQTGRLLRPIGGSNQVPAIENAGTQPNTLSSNQRIHCDKSEISVCASAQGGQACVTQHCGNNRKATYICERKDRLKECLKFHGGLTCFGPDIGNCRG